MAAIPDRGEDALYDTLVFFGVVLIAFGFGQRLERWLADGAYTAPVLYVGILVVVYLHWVLDVDLHARLQRATA